MLALCCFIGGCSSSSSPGNGGGNGKDNNSPQQAGDKGPVEKYIDAALNPGSDTSKEQQYYHLLHAQLFGRRKAEITAALAPLKDQPFALVTDPEEQKLHARLGNILLGARTSFVTLQGMVNPTPESDRVEAAILQDDRLIGDGRCQQLDPQGVNMLLCLRPTLLTASNVEGKHGKPQKEHKAENGTRFLFYGRTVVIAEKDNAPLMVIRIAK